MPLGVMFRDIAPAPDKWYWMGTQPDIAIINIGNYSPGDELTVGSDTWKVFPWVRKQFLDDETEETRHGGVAYKKTA